MWTGSHVNSSSQKPQEALSTSRHPTPRQAGEFRGPPKGGAKRGADADPAVGRPLPSAPNRAHATLSPGAREQSPRPRHGRPTTRLGHPWAATQLPRAPPSLFGWRGAERPPAVPPPPPRAGRAPPPVGGVKNTVKSVYIKIYIYIIYIYFKFKKNKNNKN